MGKVLDFFKDNPEVAGSIASVAPTIMGLHQRAKAKNAIYGEGGYMQKLESIERSREQLVNPFETIENPYKNLSVATKAAEMQAEQTDIALANTLDTLRETGKGAGGATAIAQAALKSKQNVAASIEQQEAQNEKLKAQGQLQVDIAKGKGEMFRMQQQGARDTVDLNRTQELINLEQQKRAAGSSTAVLGAAGILGGLSSLNKPEVKEDETSTNDAAASGTDTSDAGFENPLLSNVGLPASNSSGTRQAGLVMSSNSDTDDDWSFSKDSGYTPPKSYNVDMFQDPNAGTDWSKSGLTGMVDERKLLQSLGLPTDNIQRLIDETRSNL